ncbi:MAG: redox-sensing transcriptional repressor Rex [Cellulomonadaceae bacterium]
MSGPAATLPPQTIERLPAYLRALEALAEDGVEVTSSAQLADLAGVGPAQVRKDLSYLGSHGRRGVGYEVPELRRHVAAALGLARTQNVVVVGAGNLGRAVARYGRLLPRGFAVVGLVDTDPGVVGTEIGGLTVLPAAELPAIVRREGVTIAILATPAQAAQEAVDAAVAAGVRAVLNFAPRRLHTPVGVTVRSVDVGGELQLLAYAVGCGPVSDAAPGPHAHAT